MMFDKTENRWRKCSFVVTITRILPDLQESIAKTCFLYQNTMKNFFRPSFTKFDFNEILYFKTDQSFEAEENVFL